MDLHTRYLTAISEHGYSVDDAQIKAVEVLSRIANELAAMPAPGAWPARFKRRHMSKLVGELANTKPVDGAYLWGGVGRGKTFMMDLFFDSLPFDDKLRFHFHRLMYRVHGQLKKLQQQ